ncbi:MAG: tyrosine-type recombinase/integrase [Bacteroidetes bacterium]|uniref:Tyrosine-type recombinase/integrase n=1 Tax=Candidatus Cryptobacteroides avicola TaxID=2840757 RepID=A0A940IIC6_9BACT|nr:tyrosine-type recombinase/integrase [Candidatus Cryptobacteroides avicola]
MAKPKRLKPKGKFVIRNRKPNAKGEVTISIIFSVNSDVVARSTGVSIKPEQWDSKKQTIIGHRDSRRLNNQLETIKRNYETIIGNYDGILTKERLSKLIDGNLEGVSQDPKKVDFIRYAIDYAKTRYETNKIGYSTYYNQGLYLEKLRRYVVEEINGEAFLPMSEVTPELLDKYKAYRMKHIGNETMNKELAPILKAIEYAVQNGLMDTRMLSLVTGGYVETKQRSYTGEIDEQGNNVHFLTREQMSRFVELYPKVKYERTREIMDMFLFAFHACGLRVSDIATLEWAHIDFDSATMKKTLVKAKNFHEVHLNATAIQILRKWQNKGYNPRFVFNLLPKEFKFTDKDNQELCDKELKMKINSKNRTIGQSLREIGLKIGVEGFNLSMHVARHTFAVYALNPPINMSLHLVSRLLGHSSITATEKNYAKFLPETISEEVESRLQFSDYNPL